MLIVIVTLLIEFDLRKTISFDEFNYKNFILNSFYCELGYGDTQIFLTNSFINYVSDLTVIMKRDFTNYLATILTIEFSILVLVSVFMLCFV